jgi:hypothetical protein
VRDEGSNVLVYSEGRRKYAARAAARAP